MNSGFSEVYFRKFEVLGSCIGVGVGGCYWKRNISCFWRCPDYSREISWTHLWNWVWLDLWGFLRLLYLNHRHRIYSLAYSGYHRTRIGNCSDCCARNCNRRCLIEINLHFGKTFEIIFCEKRNWFIFILLMFFLI